VNWAAKNAPLMTRWSAEVGPDQPWPEYPRPQLTRPEWMNLNGLWEYSISPREQLIETDFSGEILVPYPLESALSGVGRMLEPEERLWYRRRFRLPPAWRGRRVLLHFGAVDWEATVLLNGREIGCHTGGYLPFSFEISDDLREGENELLVAVWDPTDDHWQARGKQVRKPGGIWYTRVSGIWQTVWLEPVPETYISGLKIVPDLDAASVRVEVTLDGKGADATPLRVTVADAGRLAAQAAAPDARSALEISLPDPQPWSPESPHLYELTVVAGEDRVGSYFGLRKFGLVPDAQGRPRLSLNDRPYFQFGPLDQGYWPDGLYTPPSMAAVRWELETIKRLGCNMLRKHVKVEPARYYYECDRLGLIVWQDMPNGGRAQNELEAFLSVALRFSRDDRRLLGRFGRGDPASQQDFLGELREMVDALEHFACIAVWVPFNEGWGQFRARAAADWLREYDPARLVDHASGWYDRGGGDLNSLHIYVKRLPSRLKDRRRAVALTEYGGYNTKVPGHLWDAGAEFGYVKFDGRDSLTDGYIRLLSEQLTPWIDNGLSAAIYTQTTDVEIEVNGYLTYDRAVEKMDFERVRTAHAELLRRADPDPPA
jgi:beta-galactosidase/beta-glucuronidase